MHFPLAMSFFGGEPLAQVLLVLAMLFTGLYNALWKEPVAVLGGKRLIFLRSGFVLLMVVPYAIFSGIKSFNSEVSFESLSFLALLSVGLLAYPGLYFFVKATKSGPTVVVVPVASSFTILFPAAFHVIYLQDWDFHVFSLIGFGLLILGLLMLKFRITAGRIVYTGDAGFRYAFLSAILMGTVFLIADRILVLVGETVLLLVQEGSVLLFSLIHILISRYIGSRKILRGSNSPFRWSRDQMGNHWKNYAWIIGMIGILSGIAEVSRMAATNTPLPMATFVMSFSVLVTVVAAQVYYSEKLRTQQWLAVFCLLAGIFIISWIGDGQLRDLEMFQSF